MSGMVAAAVFAMISALDEWKSQAAPLPAGWGVGSRQSPVPSGSGEGPVGFTLSHGISEVLAPEMLLRAVLQSLGSLDARNGHVMSQAP